MNFISSNLNISLGQTMSKMMLSWKTQTWNGEYDLRKTLKTQRWQEKLYTTVCPRENKHGSTSECTALVISGVSTLEHDIFKCVFLLIYHNHFESWIKKIKFGPNVYVIWEAIKNTIWKPPGNMCIWWKPVRFSEKPLWFNGLGYKLHSQISGVPLWLFFFLF